ncbi:MAG: hypothetical protein K2F64_03135 [Muribaculaceae bacterium]|nr:hypothetical protein [Muribaculaceae bacterium]
MKKSLLLASMALSSFALFAQNYEGGSEIMTVTFNGVEVQNGGSIVCNEFESDVDGDRTYITYDAKVFVTNKTTAPLDIAVTMLAVNPSYTTISGNPDLYGMPQICSPSGCLPSTMGNFGAGRVSMGTDSAFEWDLHCYDAAPEGTATYRVQMINIVNDDLLTDPQFYFDITFTTEDSAVDAVEIDENLPMEYYDLQGRRVENPAKGLYIIRQGNKSAKRIIR